MLLAGATDYLLRGLLETIVGPPLVEITVQ